MIIRPILVPFVAFLLGANAALRAADYDVRTFGATGDGKTLDTAAINKAIDAAAAAGGGVVRLPAGTHTVTFRYEPASWRVGWITSAIALVVILGAVALGLRRRRTA